MAQSRSNRRKDDSSEHPPDASKFHALLVKLREEEGISQADLSRRVGVTQTYISRWEQTRVPPLEMIWRLEVLGFDLAPGTITRALGFVQDASTIPELIASDANLNSKSREILLAAYEAATS